MRASLLSDTLIAVGELQPVWLWGPPGTGKSKLIHKWARTVGELRDLRACLLESVDLRGLPKLTNDAAVWLPPAFLPRSGRGVLFLDELAQAPIPVQNACLQLALDRKVGEYTLPDGWHVVAASNRLEDRAGVNRTTSALNSRFLHLDLEVSSDDWLTWAAEEGVSPEVRSFISFRPSLLHKFDPAERSSPNPRSWEFVSRLLPKVPGPEAEHPIVAGLVGKGAAAEFLAHRRIYSSIPNLDELLYKGAKIPDDPSVKHAIIGATTELLRDGLDKKNNAVPPSDKVVSAVCGLFNRLGSEFTVCAYRQGCAIKKDLVKHKTAVEWITKHTHLFKG
jgi:hypothetical protein